MVFLSQNGRGQNDLNFPFKNAMIRYQHSSPQVNEEVLFISDYGKYFLDLTISANENLSRDTIGFLVTDYKAYEISYSDQSVFPISQQDYSGYKGKLISTGQIDAMGFVETGTETVFGLKCQRYSGRFGEFWLYRGIVIQSNLMLMNQMNQYKLVQIDTVSRVSSYIFEITKNFTINN